MKLEKSEISLLEQFLSKQKEKDLVTTYLFFLGKKFLLSPVVFMKKKKIYRSKECLIDQLASLGELYRATQISINVDNPDVDANTTKVYICPFSGKVFGDNTTKNPQDAIYDWVSSCPENTTYKDGMKVKKFYVSEDPEIIANYMQPTSKPIAKVVYTSIITGKLFDSKEGIIKDTLDNHIKDIPLEKVTSQNRFEIDEDLLDFIQSQLDEKHITAFVEALSSVDQLVPYVQAWQEEEE